VIVDAIVDVAAWDATPGTPVEISAEAKEKALAPLSARVASMVVSESTVPVEFSQT
jgi:hypothetical protein